ncbi:MAG: cell division protein FtsA [Deltaproteobacteria bacterium]|jgi:cell division protein FtsA|nr:cell division protein FtsA [Deltaproteobacteria bacterium]
MSKSDEVLVAIDIGTTKIACLVAEKNEESGLNIKAIGYAPSDGLANGRVIDMQKTERAIVEAVDKASQYSGYDCQSAYIGIAGEHIKGTQVYAPVAVNGSGVINQSDIDRAINSAMVFQIPTNHTILDRLPMEFWVDGMQGITNPINMRGHTLEMFLNVFTVDSNCLNDLCQCVHSAGLGIENVYLESVASAEAVLTQAEKQQGVLLLDIGGGTTGMAVFMNGVIHHVQEIAVGGDALTCDLATSLNISLDSAERLKLSHGYCFEGLLPYDYGIEVPCLDEINTVEIGADHVCMILRRRMSSLFAHVNRELIYSGYDEGVKNVVVTGGSSLLMGIRELGVDIFNRQIRVGYPLFNGSMAEMVGSPIYSTAVGLMLYSQNNLSNLVNFAPRKSPSTGVLGKFMDFLAGR